MGRFFILGVYCVVRPYDILIEILCRPVFFTIIN